MVNTRWRMEIRDDSLAIIGVCDVYTDFTARLSHRAPGGWTMVLPADHDQSALFVPGSRLVAWAPWSVDVPFLTGPATAIAVTTPPSATMTVNGVDDTALLADRLVLPDPTSALDDQDDSAYYTLTAAAEGVIRQVVEDNAGTLALTGRYVCNGDPDSRLTVPGSLLGSTTSITARFTNLLTLIAEVASRDNLAVSVVQVGEELHLLVSESIDRTASVRLSQDTGTLTSGAASLSMPTTTRVLVAGGGEGVDRVFVERSNPSLEADWSRRVEVFRDARDTSDLTELQQRGDETLADAAASVAGISLDPVDLPGQGFGTHYHLGDTITVEMGSQSWTDIVTQVDVQVSAAGSTVVKPTVGASTSATPAIYRRVRDLTRRLEALERRQ